MPGCAVGSPEARGWRCSPRPAAGCGAVCPRGVMSGGGRRPRAHTTTNGISRKGDDRGVAQASGGACRGGSIRLLDAAVVRPRGVLSLRSCGCFRLRAIRHRVSPQGARAALQPVQLSRGEQTAEVGSPSRRVGGDRALGPHAPLTVEPPRRRRKLGVRQDAGLGVAARTSSTGTEAWRTMYSALLPSSRRLRP